MIKIEHIYIIQMQKAKKSSAPSFRIDKEFDKILGREMEYKKIKIYEF